MVLKDETRSRCATQRNEKNSSRIFHNGTTDDEWCPPKVVLFFVIGNQGCREWNTISQVSTLPSTNNLRHCPKKTTLPISDIEYITAWCFQRFSVYPVVKWSSFTNAFQMGWRCWSHHSSYSSLVVGTSFHGDLLQALVTRSEAFSSEVTDKLFEVLDVSKLGIQPYMVWQKRML